MQRFNFYNNHLSGSQIYGQYVAIHITDTHPGTFFNAKKGRVLSIAQF